MSSPLAMDMASLKRVVHICKLNICAQQQLQPVREDRKKFEIKRESAI
jgi:hypothetical protein